MKQPYMDEIEIASCGVSDCEPSWNWETGDDGFTDFDLWAVFRGRGMLEGAGAQYVVRQGACLLLPPNIPYHGAHNPKMPLLVMNVHFKWNDAPIRDGILAKRMPDPFFFQTMLQRMISSFNAGAKEEATAYLRAALVEFLNAEPLEDPVPLDISWNQIVEEICNYVDTTRKMPTLTELSARYGYTQRYIGKMFREIKGVSFSDYTFNSRVGRVKVLLRTTNMTLAEIAEEAGFYDACHLSKVFHSITGMTPRTFRFL